MGKDAEQDKTIQAIRNDIDDLIDKYKSTQSQINLLENRIQCSEHEKRLSQMEGRLDVAIETINKTVTKVDTILEKHDKAIESHGKSVSRLKHWLWITVAVSLFIGTIVQDRRFGGLNDKLNSFDTKVEKLLSEQKVRKELEKEKEDVHGNH